MRFLISDFVLDVIEPICKALSVYLLNKIHDNFCAPVITVSQNVKVKSKQTI